MRDIEHYNIEDASTVLLEFASGTIANISSTDLLPSGAGKTGLDLVGRDIRLEHNHRSLTVYRSAERTIYDAQNDAYFVEDKAFVEAVASKDASKLLCTYDDALRTHMVTMAANRSLATGRPELV
jgi:predicted dehydrogenase